MQKDERLQELNGQCRRCLEIKEKNFMTINGKDCETCPIGLEIRELDRSEWHEIDWNSSKWEQFYRN